MERERKKLDKNLRGIKDMERLPDIIFVVDTNREVIARQGSCQAGDSSDRRGGHQQRS